MIIFARTIFAFPDQPGRSRRIPEKAFFMLAIVGGAFGILVGGAIYHHRKLKDCFVAIVMIATLAWMTWKS